MTPAVGNDVDRKVIGADLIDGERDAIDRDRALDRDQGGEVLGDANLQTVGLAHRFQRGDGADGVDVAEHDVTAQLVTDPERTLQIDGIADLPTACGGDLQGRTGSLHPEPVGALVDHGQADARGGDRATKRNLGERQPGLDDQTAAVLPGHVADAADVGDDAREHGASYLVPDI